MATISNLGVGSNLDLTTLYNQLESAENTKLTTITNQQSTYNAQLSAYGKLQSALTNLQTATANLGKTATWNSTAVTSSNTAFSATSTGDATVGNYNVNVIQVAKAQVLTSGSFASSTSTLGGTTSDGTRKLTITQPGTTTPLEVTLSDSDTSLTGIASAINKANGNVTATVVKAGDNDYRLMLSSKSTGTAYDMTVSSDDPTLQQAMSLTVQSASQNAKVSVNDITIERSDNTISDALPGLTLTLKSKSTADEGLVVSRTTDSNNKAITDWVTAYNSLQSTIASVTKYAAVDAGSDQSANNGALVGDGNVRSIQSQLRSLLTNVQGGTYAIAAQLGITQDPITGSDGSTGNLKIDATKLTKALSDNPQAVQQYFIGDGKTTGFATLMTNTLTKMLDTSSGSSGVIKNATDGINSTLKTLSQRYDDMSDTIDSTMARYKAQFTSLDTLISQLNNTASYLTQQFSSK
ncbi:MAG TPA: flagellar filament capping protein FliD [Scandinavium sp.]|jgi:flagellar hook-associated protein 2|uniref:flagellar filament capping protein FliD n=1 Tax=Scandinavium sp. TaxID=2830653 RepID=UPI002E34F8C7|nr:flagellar filament capping protein FliD [Scandinavium sp.]HEX4500790.1 flagellar filament capping protein FliD [Scandinavium sp.]